jgi:hypothetical protein
MKLDALLLLEILLSFQEQQNCYGSEDVLPDAAASQLWMLQRGNGS